MYIHKLVRVSLNQEICTLNPARPLVRVGWRTTDNDYKLSSRNGANRKVSRYHFHFVFDPDSEITYLVALRTTFGTFINGTQVKDGSRTRLSSGDIVAAGDPTDVDLQICYVIDTDVQVIFANVPNPAQVSVRTPLQVAACKEEMKKEEKEEPIENNVHAELRVRSVETLTDANSVLVDLRSNFQSRMKIISRVCESNVHEELTQVNPGMQYDDPCFSQQEEVPVSNFTYATEEYIEILEDDQEEVPTETFEECDIKYKLRLQSQDLFNEAKSKKAKRERQNEDIFVITLVCDDDDDEDIEITEKWQQLLTLDQDKKIVVKSEIQDDSDIEIIELVEDTPQRENDQTSNEQNETVCSINEEIASDHTSSPTSKDKMKSLRRRSLSSGRKQRLPSSSDDDDEPSRERERSSKPKAIHRSRLENFRESIILEKKTKLAKISSSGRRTRSMSRGAETDFHVLPDNYKEQPLRRRSRSNVKSRSKSREKRPRRSRSNSNVKSRNKSHDTAPPKSRSKSNIKSRSKSRETSRETSSPSKGKQQSNRSRKPSPKVAAVSVENRRRTRSMTRNEETEFVSLSQNYGRRRSSSRPNKKLPVLEDNEDGQPKGVMKNLQDSKTAVNVLNEKSRKNQEKLSAEGTLTFKESQQRFPKNDAKRQADSKLSSCSTSSKKKRRSSSQSIKFGKESSRSEKPEPKSVPRISDTLVRKRTRSPLEREENSSPKKKSKPSLTDKTHKKIQQLFGDDVSDSIVNTKVTVEHRQPVEVREEILNKESLVDSPRTISETSSETSDSHQVGKDSYVMTTSSTTSKRIQVIDALPLTLERQRRSSMYSSAYRTDDEQGETAEEDFSSGKKLNDPQMSAEKADEPKKTSASKKLSEKEKTDEKARLKKEYEIEKKRRLQRHPWANIPGLKTSAPSSKSTPSEKREFINRATEKLAQKSSEKPKPDAQQRSAPRVKLCFKSRGDLLCEDMVKSASDNKENTQPDKNRQSVYNNIFMRSILKKKTGPELKKKIEEPQKPKKKTTFASTVNFRYIPSNWLSRQEEKSLAGQEDSLSSIEDNSGDEIQIMEPVMLPDEDYPSSPHVNDTATCQYEKIPVSVVISPKDLQNDHQKDDKKDHKTADQKDHQTDHRKDVWKDHRNYHRKNHNSDDQIDHVKDDRKDYYKNDDRRHSRNNQQNDRRHNQNDHSKRQNNESHKNRVIAHDAKESGFRLVWIILQWNPKWIKDQMKYTFLPPLINHDSMVPLLKSYKSCDQYIKQMKPCIILELWSYIRKSYDENKPVQQFFVSKSIEKSNKNQVYMAMELQTLVSKPGYEEKSYPPKDSLVTIRYKATDAHETFLFCHVTDVRQTIIGSTCDKHLKQVCEKPYAIVTLSIRMKKSSMPMPSIKQKVKISHVAPIKQFIKMWESTHTVRLHRSQLSILDPAKTPHRSNSQNEHSLCKLFDPFDKLDEEQHRAVLEAKTVILNQEEQILSIDGLPGTGKSHVVVRIAAESIVDEKRRNKSKVIVCAPTEPAVDVLAVRLIDLNSKLSKKDKFKLIRVGEISDPTDTKVYKIQLRTCAEESVKKSAKYKSENAKKNIMDNELSELIIKKMEISILQAVDVILCTVESCTTDVMESLLACKVQLTCIIDNASRCTEPETLIPFLMGVKSLILVGNSEQSTMAQSSSARLLGLKESLFSRIVKMSNNVITLKTQYRGSVEVFRPFNEYYCDGKIGIFKAPIIRFLCPYLILKHNERNDQDEASFINKLVLAICSIMDRSRPLTIGVITHNNDLAMAIKRNFVVNNSMFEHKITVETYRKFENQERDVIIVTSAMKFQDNDLYVALSRARHCLYLCANYNNPLMKFTFAMQALLRNAIEAKTYKEINMKSTLQDLKDTLLPP